MNSALQHVEPISLMIERPQNSLDFDLIYINDDDNSFCASSYHTPPGGRPLYVSIVEQLLVSS